MANAATVDIDFLQILMDELAAQGASYTVVKVQQEADVEAPSFVGTNPFSPAADASDIRLTMRDAILMKVDPGLTVLNAGSANYATRFTVGIGQFSYSFLRGYVWPCPCGRQDPALHRHPPGVGVLGLRAGTSQRTAGGTGCDRRVGHHCVRLQLRPAERQRQTPR